MKPTVHRQRFPLLQAAGILMLWCTVVLADGILIPQSEPGVYDNAEPFAIKYHRVQVEIDRQAAITSIDQVFINENDRDLEGIYIFPIPENVSISDFSMWMNDKQIHAELLDAGSARQIYEDIVRRRRDPALLEYAGRDLFRARVYPIPKHSEVRIEIQYQELLKYDGGLIGYRYPLNTEKFSSRDLQEVTVSVNIKSDTPIKSLYCPSHETDIRIEKTAATCGFEEKNVKPDRDFLLYYSVSEEDVGLSLITYKPDEEDGYFILLLAPGEFQNKEKALQKDVIFVVDTSGSMRGEKIEQTRAALEFCLKKLQTNDRFNIITFATGITKFSETPLNADSDNISKALRFVSKIQARGGTAIDEALQAALNIPDSGHARMIIFMTDGEPTVGETDISKILAHTIDRNSSRLRIFPFGVGYDVNTHLLDQLSIDNRGVVEYIKPEENIETKVAMFFNKFSYPVLSDISLDFGRIHVADTYPSSLPDIFHGSQLVLLGRYESDGAVAIQLSGRSGDRTESFTYEGRFTNQDDGNDFIPRLWASRKIAYLLSEIRLHGENRELVDEVIQLSKEHGIITPYTSYLIVEEGPQEYAEMMLDESDAAPSSIRTYSGAMKSSKGEAAFDASREIAAEKQSSVLSRPKAEKVKYVGGKTFYRTDHGWRDADVRDADMRHGAGVIEIPFLSGRYFDLLNKYPETGKYLSLGVNTTFSYNNNVYHITT
ncbi:MAG: VWA domain-containing protein [Candidatus Eisenbacteria bacterium]|uniref:VWA domain-containing protein n=1 Tax=Eiseniibacteriota bacterium TaxID=2212470 RepID=A0A948RYT9_UNCEI|nr:VWA domain-containing protein [Candidatus Eisenbacteria bacterium]MBU1949979.1 VWA domain-containing protein [Candidatus Eisenbacteria bacterium]MBU2692117.1 VWA domain-containing protein [Candidatus Eisenbacteria bacterium]